MVGPGEGNGETLGSGAGMDFGFLSLPEAQPEKNRVINIIGRKNFSSHLPVVFLLYWFKYILVKYP